MVRCKKTALDEKLAFGEAVADALSRHFTGLVSLNKNNALSVNSFTISTNTLK